MHANKKKEKMLGHLHDKSGSNPTYNKSMDAFHNQRFLAYTAPTAIATTATAKAT